MAIPGCGSPLTPHSPVRPRLYGSLVVTPPTRGRGSGPRHPPSPPTVPRDTSDFGDASLGEQVVPRALCVLVPTYVRTLTPPTVQGWCLGFRGRRGASTLRESLGPWSSSRRGRVPGTPSPEGEGALPCRKTRDVPKFLTYFCGSPGPSPPSKRSRRSSFGPGPLSHEVGSLRQNL